MRRVFWCLMAAALVGSGSGRVSAEVVQLWRSPFGSAYGVSVDPRDGSCWAATAGSLMHVSADGAILQQVDGFQGVEAVAVSSSDGSVWAIDQELFSQEVVHLSAGGAVLWHAGDFLQGTEAVCGPYGGPRPLAVDPRDGSCWVVSYYGPTGGPNEPRGQVTHISSGGSILWSGREIGNLLLCISVDPNDGSCWVTGPGGDPARAVVHLSASGEVLWTGAGNGATNAVAVDPRDSSCWVSDGSSLQHLSREGTLLSTTKGLSNPSWVVVNPADGTVWLEQDAGSGFGRVAHLETDGKLLWHGGSFCTPMSISVDPRNGSCWVADWTDSSVVHLSAQGDELWRGRGYRTLYGGAISPSDGTLWLGEVRTDGDYDLLHLAGDTTELGRSTIDEPWEITAGPTDGSCWLLTGSFIAKLTLAHVSSAGEELWRGSGYSPETRLAPCADGSYWLIDGAGYALLRLAADGSELVRATLDEHPGLVAADPVDGSCWVTTGGATPRVRHLSAEGEELANLAEFDRPGDLSIDPVDHSCWVWDSVCGLAHYTARGKALMYQCVNGQETWASLAADPADGSLWVDQQGVLFHLTERGDARWHAACALGALLPRPQDASYWSVCGSQLVHVSPTLSARFRGAPLFGTSSVDVSLTEASLGAESLTWDFGDGETTTERRPSPHHYTAVGTYPVTLTITGGQGADTLRKPHYVLVSFPDVPEEHWALRSILACVDAEIVAGYPDGLYHPTDSVTRDQMAVYIARALAKGDANVPSGPAQPSFGDVPTDQWAYRYIEYCAAADVVRGYPDGLYHPDKIVNRGQMAVYVARAQAGGDAKVPEDSDNTPTFPDVISTGDWAWCYRYVEYCAAQHIVSGYSDGTYRPAHQVTRDQMAVYVERAFQLPM